MSQLFSSSIAGVPQRSSAITSWKCCGAKVIRLQLSEVSLPPPSLLQPSTPSAGGGGGRGTCSRGCLFVVNQGVERSDNYEVIAEMKILPPTCLQKLISQRDPVQVVRPVSPGVGYSQGCQSLSSRRQWFVFPGGRCHWAVPR